MHEAARIRIVPPPMTYVPRLVDRLLDEISTEISAVMLTGPRACGKTTTAARRAGTVVRLDADSEAAAFVADPDAALRGLPEPVLLDEWQAVPGVLGAARRAVDADPRPGRFYATGSVRAELDRSVWPGTGRFVRIALHPLTQREIAGDIARPSFFDRAAAGDLISPLAGAPPDLRGYVEIAARSGFPRAAFTESPRARRLWLASYLEDLLTHDAEEAAPSRTRRRDPGRMRSWFEAYALNSSGTPEQRTIFEAAGVARDTAVSYESLLTRLMVVDQAPAWSSNRLRRLVHAPKRYVVDPALVMTALGLTVDGVLADGDMLGRILEGFVMAQLRPEIVVSESRPRLHHLRTEGGRREIDLIAELGGERVIGIEIKATATPRSDDGRHLRWLRDEIGPRFVQGVVLHTGPRAFQMADRIAAIPIAAIWS